MWAVLNILFSLMAALALSFVVLHPSIREGLWIKAGFIVMIISLLASAGVSISEAPIQAAFNAGLALRAGIVVASLGYAFKYRKAKRDCTPTDFGSLTER